MRNEELFKQFVEFCESQPEDKVIDHSTWESCAVGDFLRYQGLEYIGSTLDTPEIEQVIVTYEGWGGSNFRSAIGNGKCPSTYGKFSKWLRSYL